VPQSGSAWQVGEQPSKGSVLPSSHPSPASSLPLPQTAWVQVEGVPEQPHPGSTLQVGEQPSPLTVLPSSHCSLATILESPHNGTQGLPDNRHCQPVSTLQVELQPSPLVVLPSSQVSDFSSTPLPQRALSVHAPPAAGQLQELEASLQPSQHDVADGVPPSSHCSPAVTRPSPHTGT